MKENSDSEKKGKYAELTSVLTPEAVDEAAELVIDFLSEQGIDRAQIIKVRLSIEESLGLWCEHASGDDSFTLKLRKKWNGYEIKLEAEGPALDPYSVKSSGKDSGFGNRLLVELGLVPEYSRRYDANVLVFKLKNKPMNPIAKILCVIAGAVILGFLMSLLLPENVINGINDGFITPVYKAYFRLLGAAAGPMIFLSVAWGIYGIGDAVTLGRIGKKLLGLFMAVNAAGAFFSLCFYFPLGPQLSAEASGEGGVSSIFNMILDIVPSSIVEPFSSGNTLQIIFLAIIMGTAMLYLGRRTQSVAKAVEQFNYLIQYLMRFVADQVPAITFLVILKMMISGTMSIMGSSLRLLVCVIPAEFIFLILVCVLCAVILKISPVSLAKKTFPLFLISITTASSAAGFDINSRITRDEMGVDPSLAGFGVPLGMVVCRVGASIYFPLLCFHFAKLYGVPLSWQTIITIVISVVFIAVASPPIPGGGAAAYVALFTQVGIPAEAVATALALDVVMDFIMTALCETPIPMLLAVLAKKTGKLNEKKLCG